MVELLIGIALLGIFTWRIVSKKRPSVNTDSNQPGSQGRTPPWDEPPPGPPRG